MEKAKAASQKLPLELFIVYLFVLVWIILFKMAVSWEGIPQLQGVNFIPYGASVIVNNQLQISEIIFNILIFIPFGLYLSILKPYEAFWKKTLFIMGFSLLLEILQYLFAIGASDITDLINNTLGGIIGLGLYLIISKLLKEKTNQILTILASIVTLCVILFLGFILVVNG